MGDQDEPLGSSEKSSSNSRPCNFMTRVLTGTRFCQSMDWAGRAEIAEAHSRSVCVQGRPVATTIDTLPANSAPSAASTSLTCLAITNGSCRAVCRAPRPFPSTAVDPLARLTFWRTSAETLARLSWSESESHNDSGRVTLLPCHVSPVRLVATHTCRPLSSWCITNSRSGTKRDAVTQQRSQ